MVTCGFFLIEKLCKMKNSHFLKILFHISLRQFWQSYQLDAKSLMPKIKVMHRALITMNWIGIWTRT